MISETEAKRIADAAATAAVDKAFMRLGIDHTDPVEAKSFRDDLHYVHSLREASALIKKQGLKTAAMIVVTAILGAVWLLTTGRF